MQTAPVNTLVAEVLEEYGAAARGVLFTYLPNQEPKNYLYDLVADYPSRGGRAFRPAFCIATARAFGAPLDAALTTAASIEMMHNAMLIHDDIEDDSEERRGQPTLHLKEGVPMAINAGDSLALLSIRPLLDNQQKLGPDLSLALLQETDRMARESAEGQAMELGWRRDNIAQVSEADYLFMVLKKTCWLTTIHPLRTGSLIGAADKAVLEGCIRFGYLLGAAFQIQDDLLNLVGDATAYGKEIGGDIYEGKRTLMLIHLMERCESNEKTKILQLLGTPRQERDSGAITWVRERMDHYGSLEYARQVAQGLAGAASAEFSQLFGTLPASRDKEFIRALPQWVIQRN